MFQPTMMEHAGRLSSPSFFLYRIHTHNSRESAAIPDCAYELGDIDRKRYLRIIRFRVTTLMQQNVCSCLIRFRYQLVLNDVKSGGRTKNSWKKVERNANNRITNIHIRNIDASNSGNRETDNEIRQVWEFEARRAKEKGQSESRKESRGFFLFWKGKRSERVISRVCIFCSRYSKLTKWISLMILVSLLTSSISRAAIAGRSHE